MLWGLEQPLTLCGSQRNFGAWIPAVPRGLCRGFSRVCASPEHLWCLCVLLEQRPHLPGMQVDRCAAESKDGVLGTRDSCILHQQVREKREIGPPASPCSHHFGLTPEQRARWGREGSPADPWRDQDPVLSRVMKCEPFPSVIFNVVLLRLGAIRRSCLLFAEPPPAPPDCSAQGKLLTAGRLRGLGSAWFWACLPLTSTAAGDFPESRVWGSSSVPVVGLKRGAGREKGFHPSRRISQLRAMV